MYNYDNLVIKVGYRVSVIGSYTVYSHKQRPQKRHQSVNSISTQHSVHREGVVTSIERITEGGKKSTRVHILAKFGKNIYRHPKFVRLNLD